MGQTNLRLIENSSMDRKKALDAALSQIERAFGKGSIMKLGANTAIEIEAIPTGSLGLDIALGIGGLPRGRVVEIFGPNRRARPRSRSRPSPRRSGAAASAPLSMPSTPSTRPMPASSGSI